MIKFIRLKKFQSDPRRINSSQEDKTGGKTTEKNQKKVIEVFHHFSIFRVLDFKVFQWFSTVLSPVTDTCIRCGS